MASVKKFREIAQHLFKAFQLLKFIRSTLKQSEQDINACLFKTGPTAHYRAGCNSRVSPGFDFEANKRDHYKCTKTSVLYQGCKYVACTHGMAATRVTRDLRSACTASIEAVMLLRMLRIGKICCSSTCGCLPFTYYDGYFISVRTKDTRTLIHPDTTGNSNEPRVIYEQQFTSLFSQPAGYYAACTPRGRRDR